ncbi:pyroglutamyl-peptidase I [Zhengella mangrovi]|uniref:Pyrrolidone-carboxylate peptidase n=1 Tax=Zhengella mangrovi TaxID=1982044 RepID=A0A2G1QN15_9HYPH|nr:pyroglutamyl-peptidase I [Zhengella mangrovi]PHP66913.1 pyroglutamyl-peptidase I [Zhengella mangrovi]
MTRAPRILVTGFGPFPGAPENPTEWLVAELSRQAGHPDYDLASAVLPVDYALAGPALDAAAAGARPDIAIHFGLAAGAAGFRLERLASHHQDHSLPDNAGQSAPRGTAGRAPVASQLPLDAVYAALAGRGLPVEWSDDAGGYLCNFVFYRSCAATLPPLAGAMSGFIHTSHVGEGEPLSPDEALDGARLILGTCARAWRTRRT